MGAQPFDFGKATFHFFNVFGRKPAAVIWIALWQAMLNAGLMYLAFVTIGDFYIWILGEAFSGTGPDEAEMFNRMGSIMSVGPLISIGGMLIALMAQGAWLRLLVRDEMAPLIPFRLAGDELHLFATNVGLLGIAIGLYFLFALVLVFTGVAVGLAAAGGGSSNAGLAGGLTFAIAVLVMLGLALFIGVRVSAAPAATVLERRIAFPAWSVTKGKFWPVLGAYILVAVMLMVLGGAFMMVVNFAFLGALMPVFQELFLAAQTGIEPNPEALLGALEEAVTSTGAQISLVSAGLVMLFFRSVYDAIWHSVGASVAIQSQATQPVSE
ncbi:hypothetical protein V0U79_12325 [Hyphobacterium sp. HN65]|uniref:Glycerophosphoryl diester phosphodiesterase membrane domain-containing protein n=1 Tax=Hyphobacterium lacteum TaxID=3116575 RepID=A0ABU7LTC0_9PROT|nr:hypothetical protein [Hyphobacterium sp. HN65]MEE2527155.1 hypothetical protein [Hyphobacterium sp. HN65]